LIKSGEDPIAIDILEKTWYNSGGLNLKRNLQGSAGSGAADTEKVFLRAEFWFSRTRRWDLIATSGGASPSPTGL